MNIYNIKRDIEAANQLCETLDIDERVKLNIGLQELCDSSKFDQILFWGRIRGVSEDYYIALGLVFKDQFEFPAKKFFFAGKDFKFKELPPIISQFKDLVEDFNGNFDGNPEKVLWESQEEESQNEEESKKEEDQEPNVEDNLDETLTDSEVEEKDKIVLLKKFTELHRLSYVIRAIEIECASVPVGSLKLTTQHNLIYNKNFSGLSLEKSLNLENWMHFRQPLSPEKKIEMENPDAVFKSDLLDPIQDDLPKNIWSLKPDISNELVTLRSFLWPGYFSFLRVNENSFGYGYFGDGVKNVEVSLLI